MTIALLLAALLQALAVAYAVFLLTRRRGAAGAWMFLLGAMLSMLVWRVVVVTGVTPPQFFNPLIAIWGSVCMVAAMFFFGREVALRQRAEAERDALLDSERAARAEAERANRLKDEFLATLSHELRTPLTAILGWCEVLRNPRVRPDDRSVAVTTIERNARVQARLIEDLLDVTRMQAGKFHLELAPCTLEGPVRSAIQAVQPAAEAKSINIVLRTGSVPAVLYADASRLDQLASNLLVNAVKFTGRGGSIEVDIETRDNLAMLTVSDTGMGIGAEFLPHLFARFRQADSSASRRHGGLGLGLSIVEHIVRAHCGQVTAHSAGRNQGAKFVVSLPLASRDVLPHSSAHPSLRPAAPESTLSGLRILIIDDEDDVRSAVRRMLEQQGAEVFAFASGNDVETALSTHRPHVLIIDIGMPGEDGYSLIRRIRRLPVSQGGSTPAISLTAHARNEDRARALGAGFQQHLAKPVDLALLTGAVYHLTATPTPQASALPQLP